MVEGLCQQTKPPGTPCPIFSRLIFTYKRRHPILPYSLQICILRSVDLLLSLPTRRQGPADTLAADAAPAISQSTLTAVLLHHHSSGVRAPLPFPATPCYYHHATHRDSLAGQRLLRSDNSSPNAHPGAFHSDNPGLRPGIAKTPPTLFVMHHKQLDQLAESLPYRSANPDHSEPAPLVSTTMDTTQALSKHRPDHTRSSTDPSPAALLQGYFSSPPAPRPTSSHRNRSPYSRPHVRSRSGGSSLAAPPMTRAYSLPTVNLAGQGFDLQTASPPSSGSLSPSPAYASPARARSPFKTVQDEGYVPPPRSPSFYDNNATAGGAIESIQEDSELDITPRQQPAASASASFSRSGSLRRRPASPLHSFANVPAIVQQSPTSFPANVIDQNAHINMNPSSTSSSPSLGAQKYNEAFPSTLSLHHYASNSSFSSISSTPSSARSRSPSISSLDTIEDAPDLESEAVEEESQRLKLIAESDEEDEGPRRRSLDVPRGFGFGRNGGSGRERKRWSICGGERRADLDLETIWED